MSTPRSPEKIPQEIPEDPLQDIKKMVLLETEQRVPDDKLKELEVLSFSGFDQDKVNFAVALLQNDFRENQIRGVALLKAIYTSIQRVSQYFSDADKDLARHCLYQLTLGYFILHKYIQSIEYGRLLLQITPNHQQVKAIIALIEEASTIGQTGENKEKKGIFSRRGKKKEEKLNNPVNSPSQDKKPPKRSITAVSEKGYDSTTTEKFGGKTPTSIKKPPGNEKKDKKYILSIQ